MTQPRVCAVALAYARGEVRFIGEWLEYHLAVGIGHIFLGLHVNDDLLPADHYLTVKRPYPAMYEPGVSEADVVRDFLLAVEPFRDRVTTYVLHRDFSSEPDGHRDAQRRLYNAVLGQQRRAFDWIGPFDIDEYLVPQPPFESVAAALGAVPDRFAAVTMEQVIAEPRWDDDRRPRPAPLVKPDLRRCSEVVPLGHGIKTYVRPAATASLAIHEHQLVAGALQLGDRRILSYHFRGFPALVEEESSYRLPIEHQVFDLVDPRPWRLREQAHRETDPEEPTR